MRGQESTFAQRNISITVNSYSSKLLEEAVNEFARLPGIGRKTALRLVLHILRQKPEDVTRFAGSLTRLRNEIHYCKQCHNISESEICNICADSRRDRGVICVVEDIRDVLAVENTSQYRGLYHLLGGVISPMEGIGPADLNIESLLDRVAQNETRELVMALRTTMEGDTTVFYLYKKLKDHDVAITTIARGIAIGDELEYADEITLGRSIVNRVPYDGGRH